MRHDLDKIHADGDQRKHENCAQGKPDVSDHHNHKNGDNREDIRNQLCDTVVQHILQRVDIANDARQNFSGRAGIEKAEA